MLVNDLLLEWKILQRNKSKGKQEEESNFYMVVQQCAYVDTEVRSVFSIFEKLRLQSGSILLTPLRTN